MNRFGWFLSGIYALGMFVTIVLSYNNLGSVNQRVGIFVLGILGIGSCAIFLKDKKCVLELGGEE